MIDTAALRGVEELRPIDKSMLRVSDPDWGSKLVECGNGDLRLHCGGSAWGYAAEFKLTDLLDDLDRSRKHYITLTLTVLRGDISLGILTTDDKFTSDFTALPRNEKIIVPIAIDFTVQNLALMIRNGAQPNSIVRIHAISLEKAKDEKAVASANTIETIDEANADFWSELCGTKQAQLVGITDFSPRSLKRFDDWYFNYYPHLFVHIPFTEMAGLDVLEVGLGYGTVSQRLAEWGSRFVGLDITPGAADLVNRRLRQAGLPGEARVGSILDAPFANESFDRIVTISTSRICTPEAVTIRSLYAFPATQIFGHAAIRIREDGLRPGRVQKPVAISRSRRERPRVIDGDLGTDLSGALEEHRLGAQGAEDGHRCASRSHPKAKEVSGVLLKSGLRPSPSRAGAGRSSLARKGRRRADEDSPGTLWEQSPFRRVYQGKLWQRRLFAVPEGPSRRRETPRSSIMRSGMRKMLALGLTASVLLGAVPAATTPASAYVRHYGHVHHYYRHYGYYHHRHYGAAPFAGAVGALIGGIAAGEAARHYYGYGPYPYGYYGGGPYYGYGPYGYAY